MIPGTVPAIVYGLGHLPPLPYVAGSETSKAAAESMRKCAAFQRGQVYDAICDAGVHGLTREEIEAETGLPGNSVRPRVVELIEGGMIKSADEKRRTASGRRAEVLVAVGVA